MTNPDVPEGVNKIIAALSQSIDNIPSNEIEVIQRCLESAAAIINDVAQSSGSPLLANTGEALADAQAHSERAAQAARSAKEELAAYMASISGVVPAELAVVAPAQPEVEEVRLEDQYTRRIAEDIEKALEGGVLWGSGIMFMLHQCLSRNDIKKAEAYLPLLRRSGDVDVCFAEACYAIGTEYAFSVLREELAADRDRRLAKYLRLREEEPEQGGVLTMLYGLLPDLMKSVIIECRNRGLSADAWIDEYTINAEERWGRRWQYYEPVAEGITGFSTTPPGEQTGLEKLAQAYLDDTNLEGSAVHAQLGRIIKHVKDPALKERLLRRYMAETPGAIVGKNTCSELMDLGGHMLDQPACTPDTVEFFTSSIDKAARDLVEAGTWGENWADVCKLSWQVEVMHTHDRAPVEQTIALVHTITGLLLTRNSDMPEYSRELAGSKSGILIAIDGVLHRRALRSAEYGDFAAAGAFVAAISYPSRRKSAAKLCLPYLRTKQDMQYFKPDEIEGLLDPVQARRIKVLEVIAGDDIKATIAIAGEAIHDSEMDLDAFGVRVIQKVIDTDPGTGILLARQALDRMLYRMRPGDDVWGVAGLVVKYGNREDIEEVFATISKMYPDKINQRHLAYSWFMDQMKSRG